MVQHRHATVDNTKLNIQTDQLKSLEDDQGDVQKTSQLVEEEKAESGNVWIKFWSHFYFVA